MRRQLVPGPVVRLTVIKAKTRPGIEANVAVAITKAFTSSNDKVVGEQVAAAPSVTNTVDSR